MRRTPWVLAGAVSAALGCNALTGVGDLSVSSCVDDCDDAGADVAAPTPPVPDADGSDASVEVDSGDCEPGTTSCGGQCVSLSVSDDNCGACGVECQGKTACAGGKCISTCDGGVECATPNGDNVCVDRLTDPAHCGACNSPCPGGATCINGGCRYALTVNVTRPASSTSTVTSSPGSLSCPATCSASIIPDTNVTLTATPAADEVFVEWTGGGCVGRSPTCQITVDGAKTVTAKFAKYVMYGHSARTLYAVDATTGNSTLVGAFSGGCANVDIGDIAIDRNGNGYLFARSNGESRLFPVNLTTAACGAQIGGAGPICGGATFAPDPNDPSKDALYCAQNYDLVRVDATTGARTLIGDYGTNMAASGDIVWIPGKGAFITLLSAISPGLPDRLGSINLITGAVTIVGTTGQVQLFGLGHRGGNVIACSADATYAINTATAASTKLPQDLGFDCFGAAAGP